MAVALITGGLRGIGRALTAEYLKNGWSVLTLSRKDYPDFRAEVEKSATGGAWLRHMDVDLDDLEKVEAAMRKIAADASIEAAGGLRTVINNAASQGPAGTLNEIAFEDWIHTQVVNLHAPVLICKMLLPLLKKHGGAIINFSGGGGAKAQFFFSAYSTSKAAIVRFTECLARELQEDAPNVFAYTVTPGFVVTEIHQTALNGGVEKAREFHTFVEQQLKKGGNDPARIAKFCRQLADPQHGRFSGRFFSAAFDSLDDAKLAASLEAQPDLFTLRRIDDFAFKKA